MTGTNGNAPRVIGYLRVSTDEQAASGAGLGAQRLAIETAARERGWEVVAWQTDEGVSAKTIDRPALGVALAALAGGDADGLVVAKLDRLSRSVADFCGLLDRSHREGWDLALLDIGLDTSLPMGRFTAQIMASVAELERNLIGQRTRDALAVKRSEGVRLGRPPEVTPAAAARARELRAEGLSYRAIGECLTAEGVPGPRGPAWWPASVRRVCAA